MKRIMLLAAMLATALMAAAPAFAQDAGNAVATDGSTATGGDVNVQYVDCSQVQNAIVGAQGQYGDASDSASISQQLNITQVQVNACAGNINIVGGGTPTATPTASPSPTASPTPAGTPSATASPTPSATASASPTATASASSASVAVLPDTGGASLFALGAGALLVAGGLIARRIVR